ncbi:DUF2508 family protein [Bacillus sp. BGMRC 2118]|nr:DUF2508 family protein [Bacillus sp. BGMRC 2118]
MFFHRKGKLRREFNEQLLQTLEGSKYDWMKQKEMFNKCVEPSEEVVASMKIAEAKYFFLIREAKHRKVSVKG